MHHSLSTNNGEPKIVGVKDGAAQVRLDEINLSTQMDLLLSINAMDDSNLVRIDKLKDKLVFKARPQSKMTDLMQFSPWMNGCVFLASERFIQFLGEFKLPGTFLKKVDVVLPKERGILQYYLVQQELVQRSEIDYKKTVFYRLDYPDFSSLKNRYIFKDAAELEEQQKQAGFIKKYLPLDLHFKSQELEEADMITSVFPAHYISQRLSEALKKENFTNVVLGESHDYVKTMVNYRQMR